MVDLQALPAAKRAGFSQRDCRAGHRVLNLPHVQREIQRRCLETRVRLEVTGDHIRQGFAQIAFDPREPKQGGPSRRIRISALRELGKLFGLYIEKHVFTGATLEQLLAMAAEQERALPPAVVPLRLVSGGKT